MLKFLELITLCFCLFKNTRTSTYSNFLFESNTSINYEEVLSNAEPRYKFHLEGSQDHLKHINSLDKTFKKHAQTLQTLKYTKSLSCEIEEFYNNNVKLRDFLLPITSENTSSISGSKESFFNFVLNKTRVAYSESTRVDQVIEKFLGLFPFLFEKEITNEVKIEQIRKFVKLFSGYHVYSFESKICEYNNELENFDTNFIQNNNFNVLYEIYDDIITKMDYNKMNNLVFTYLLGIKEMFSLNRNINLCTKILSEKVKEIHEDLLDLNTCDKVDQISKKSSLITKLSKFQNERIFSKMNDLIYNRNLKFKNSFLPLFNKVHEEWNKASYTKKLRIIGNVYHSSLSKEKEEFVVSHLKELKNNLKFQISELERNKSVFSNKKDNESINNFNFVQDSKIRRTSYKSNSINSNVEFNSFLNYINSKYNSILEKELTNNYDKIDNNEDKDVRVPTKKIKTSSNSGDFKCKRSRSYTKVNSWKRGIYPQIPKNMIPENIQKSETVETELPRPSRDLHSNNNLKNNSIPEQSAGSKDTTNSESSSEDRVIDQYKQSQNDNSQSDAEISAGYINNDSEYVSIDSKTNSGSFQITVSSPITKNEIIKNDFTRVFQTYIYLEKSKQILEFLNHEIKEYIENPWYDTCIFLKEKISYKDNLIVMFKEISILRKKLISMVSVEDKTSIKQNKFFDIPKKFFYNEATLKILKEMFDNELENLERFIKLLLTQISNQICTFDKKFYTRKLKSSLFNENYFEYYTMSRTIDILKRDVNARFSAFFDFKSWVNNNLTRESIYNKKEAKINKLIDEYSKKFENQNKIPQKLTKFGSIILYNSSPWQFTMESLLYY